MHITAIETFAKDIFRNTVHKDSTYHMLADSLYKNNRINEAIHHFQIALGRYEKNKNYQGQIIVLNKLGHIYTVYQNDFDQAHDFLYRSLMLCKDSSMSDSTLALDTYYELGVLFDYAGNPDSALFFHDKALQKRIKLYEDFNGKIAESYNSIAEVYHYTYYDYLTAEKYYEKALSINEKNSALDHKSGSVYYSLAEVNRLKGDLEKSTTYAYKALNTYKTLNKEDYYHISICYSLLANLSQQKEEYESALVFNRKAIDLIFGKEGYVVRNLPMYYYNHGGYFLDYGLPDSTVYYCRKALNILLAKDEMNAREASTSYQFLANAYRDKNKLDSAETFYRKSLDFKLASFGNKHRQTAGLYLDWGLMYEQHHQYKKALNYYQKALTAVVENFNNDEILINPQIRQDGDVYILLRALERKGITLQKLYQFENKLNHLIASLNTFTLFDKAVSINRNAFSREGSKLKLAADFKPVYEQALHAVYSLYHLTKNDTLLNIAFRFIENNKASVLSESLRQAEFSKSALPDSLLLKQYALNARLAFHQSELIRLKRENQNNIEESNQTQLKLFDTTRDLERLKEKLQQDYANYYEFKYNDNLYSISEVQSFLNDTDGMMVEYFYGDSTIFVMNINNHTTKFSKIEIKDSLNIKLEAFIDFFNHEFSLSRAKEDYLNYTSLAYTFYQSLLKDCLINDQSSPKRLFIIPDGFLSCIPFEALITSENNKNEVDYKSLDYLLYDHQICYDFSFKLLNQKFLNKANQPVNKILAFSYEKTEVNPNRGKFIGGAFAEVNTIPDIFSTSETLVYAGDVATESNFKSFAKEADVLHLAVHGFSDPMNPQKSKLMFRTEHDSLNDGQFYAYEMYGLRLPTRLAVLSSCETGIGKYYAGEGVYSLARAFAYAGCPNAIISLWKINDETTNDIIREFYKLLAKGKSVDACIRLTKLDYLSRSDELTAHPQRWAGLISFGYATLFEEKSKSEVMIKIIASLLIITAFVFFYFNLPRIKA